jgi:hypothetical protein
MNARNLAPLLLVAALAGCVDNNASVRLSGTCSPPAPAAGVCAYSATCDSVWMDNLWVDTAYVGLHPSPLDGTLYWPFQADNQRTNNSGRDGGTNTATAFITGYKITYHSATIAIPKVTIEDSTRTIEPGASAVVSIPVIPVSVATLLAIDPILKGTVRAEIQATGTFGDGSSFETGPYSVVVDINNGAGVGYGCPLATPTLVGVCPKAGQSGVPACE